MPKGGRRQNQNGRRRRRPGAASVPRPIQNGCVVRRAYNYGNLVYPGASDAGIQIGITPSAVLDWSAYVSVWQRFRVLQANLHFIVWGQNDTTPSYTTVYVFHDTMSTGAPATLGDALVRKGRRILPLSINRIHQTFNFKPMPWSSTGLTLTMASPAMTWSPTVGFSAFTSAACWLQNYNSTNQAPGINVQVELVLQFDAPQ